MDIRLSDLASCFEGVIPSIIATASADGTPNVSYLSHVVQVDGEHIALSNQFFAKTAANIRANPNATLVLVDCLTGDQFQIDVRFVRAVDSGPLFEKVSLQLKASSAQVGMSEIMRLRSADVFRVLKVHRVLSPVESGQARPSRPPVSLIALGEAIRAVDGQTDVGGVIDSLLGSLSSVLGFHHALVLVPEGNRDCFITVGSAGYERSGLTSEIMGSEGLIGAAAASRQTIKVSDMSRMRRFGEAIATTDPITENAARVVAFPELSAAMSQIAVPMIADNEVLGVLFAESPERMAFRDEDAAALEMLAREAARALKAMELGSDASPSELPPPPTSSVAGDREVRVSYHLVDDSIFVDGTYIVKGIAGALLHLMIKRHLCEERSEFTNRELRLALAPRMPDIKDNLETRLLLLRRRLEEKQASIQIVRIERGRLRMVAAGPIVLDDAQV